VTQVSERPGCERQVIFIELLPAQFPDYSLVRSLKIPAANRGIKLLLRNPMACF